MADGMRDAEIARLQAEEAAQRRRADTAEAILLGSGVDAARLRVENEALRGVLEAARCIHHWHDALPDHSGMVVGADAVRALWAAIADLDKADGPPGGAEVERLRAENEALRLAILGGEDAPGLAASLDLQFVLECHRQNWLEARGYAEGLERVLRAVLLFYRSPPWTPAQEAEWKALTGRNEVTTRVLCDAVREVLSPAAKEGLDG